MAVVQNHERCDIWYPLGTRQAALLLKVLTTIQHSLTLEFPNLNVLPPSSSSLFFALTHSHVEARKSVVVSAPVLTEIPDLCTGKASLDKVFAAAQDLPRYYHTKEHHLATCKPEELVQRISVVKRLWRRDALYDYFLRILKWFA